MATVPGITYILIGIVGGVLIGGLCMGALLLSNSRGRRGPDHDSDDD
ncbi:MAG: hypothetical protein ACRCZF_23015 [Gemmataceae bacterium]